MRFPWFSIKIDITKPFFLGCANFCAQWSDMSTSTLQCHAQPILWFCLSFFFSFSQINYFSGWFGFSFPRWLFGKTKHWIWPFFGKNLSSSCRPSPHWPSCWVLWSWALKQRFGTPTAAKPSHRNGTQMKRYVWFGSVWIPFSMILGASVRALLMWIEVDRSHHVDGELPLFGWVGLEAQKKVSQRRSFCKAFYISLYFMMFYDFSWFFMIFHISWSCFYRVPIVETLHTRMAPVAVGR